MTSTDLPPALQGIERRLSLLLHQWDTVEETAASFVAGLVNTSQRGPLVCLPNTPTWGVLRTFPGMPERLQEKLLERTNVLFRALHAKLDEMYRVLSGLRCVMEEVWTRVRGEEKSERLVDGWLVVEWIQTIQTSLEHTYWVRRRLLHEAISGREGGWDRITTALTQWPQTDDPQLDVARRILLKSP